MITLRFGPEDVLRCRFARSPLWETMAAVRTLADERQRRHHAAWLEEIGPDAARPELALLSSLLPTRGYVPDFLTPPPARAVAAFSDELERVRRTPLARVRVELERSLRDRPGAEAVPDADALLADVRGTLQRVAAALELAWSTLLEPRWPAIRELLDEDVRYHGRLLVDGGLELLFGALHPHVRWLDGRLEVRIGLTDARELGGAGLVLMPSVFVWPGLVVILDEPWQPTLVYPARGVERLWQDAPAPPPDALARLLGRTRAALLDDLRTPATTTALARRHGLVPGTVSEQLRVLRDGGLVSSRRRGTEVVYARTELGDELCAGAGP